MKRKNPDQIVNTIVIGRNDPCLCGSGQKFKKCCQGKNLFEGKKALEWLKANDPEPPMDYSAVTIQHLQHRCFRKHLYQRMTDVKFPPARFPEKGKQEWRNILVPLVYMGL